MTQTLEQAPTQALKTRFEQGDHVELNEDLKQYQLEQGDQGEVKEVHFQGFAYTVQVWGYGYSVDLTLTDSQLRWAAVCRISYEGDEF